ncbi:GNAT family N-acetyltransferase [Leptobacterium flavescens]|uniref:GNAT family N-acetyltransferase n=1 Tax=Leptobacterium flavescens TaxID=472055 RepID=A0A6P0UJP6_9FLAO|nr:GNAT family N-acetyltransferase [Leptobacterium flavescens]NER12108.1 GNAT family N-acetyltransferase [Leptobacterium flavescens]
MQDEINIRNATKADFNAIYQFVNELEETVFGIETQKKAFERNIINTDFIYLIAELNSNPVGFVSCHSQNLLHHGGQKIAEIQELYVDPKNRKAGVGKKLIDELKRIAKKMDIEQLEVTSNKKRTETHRFYQRENFINSHEKFTFKLR